MSKKIKETVDHRTGIAIRKTTHDFGNGHKRTDVVKIMPDGVFNTRFLGSQKLVKSTSQRRSS